MTKEKWIRLEQKLVHIGANSKLKIDGYNVTLVVEPYDKLKNCIFVYV